MIYIECTYLDPATLSILGQLAKEFNNQGDFNAWYRTAKTDQYCIINFMKFNPKDNPLQKVENDRKLLTLPRIMELAI